MSGEANKNEISKNTSLFKTTNIKQNFFPQRKSISSNNLTQIKKKNINANEPLKKVINVVDFI
jgi:hypothetical protein